MRATIQVQGEMIGKYLNHYGWSDIEPRGKIIGTKGKTILIIKRIVSIRDESIKLEFIPGGFSAHCVNQSQQKWVFLDTEFIEEIRISHALLKHNKIEDQPRKYYDYNF